MSNTDPDRYTFTAKGWSYTVCAPDRSAAMQAANHNLRVDGHADGFYAWMPGLKENTYTATYGVWD